MSRERYAINELRTQVLSVSSGPPMAPDPIYVLDNTFSISMAVFLPGLCGFLYIFLGVPVHLGCWRWPGVTPELSHRYIRVSTQINLPKVMSTAAAIPNNRPYDDFRNRISLMLRRGLFGVIKAKISGIVPIKMYTQQIQPIPTAV